MSNLPSIASVLPDAAPSDRLRRNVERLFDLMLPFLSYMVPWEYTVIAASNGPPVTVDAFPVDPSRCPHGPLTGVQVWKGPSGSPSVPPVGSRVLIRFNDGNPAKPSVCGFDPVVPTIPPTSPVPVPGAPLTLAGALAQFATGLNVSTLSAQALILEAYLAGLL